MVTVDLWDIWLQVVVEYDVTVDALDFLVQPNGRYIFCFTVTWPKHPSRERYFIGDNMETVDKARLSLAKKVIDYFQTVYGFTVKEENFNRMRYSQIQCGFQRGRYRSALLSLSRETGNLELLPLCKWVILLKQLNILGKLPVDVNIKNVRRGRPTGKRHWGNSTSNLQETVSPSEFQAVTNHSEHAPTTSKRQRRRQKGKPSTGPEQIPVQLYRFRRTNISEGLHEKENQLRLFPNLNEQMMTLLMGIMDDNPYEKFFRSLQEIEVTENTRIVSNTDPTNDQRVYNAPTSDEVAVVWPDNTTVQGNEGPHIIAYGRVTDDMPESLIEAEIANAARRHTRADKRISCREYYAYKFQIRPGNFLLRGGRIFQQYIVDMYVKIEKYTVGLFTIESGYYTSGPPEIKAELSPGEEAHNRPDLVARVFHAKLTMLRKQIKEKQIFGEVAAMINVVEFQKRGLPHAHFLIILKPAYKITAPEKFDRYVSAEIPTNDNPHLRAVVLKHMMHGPCGTDFPKCACMKVKDKQKICEKKYPKNFREFTTNGKDSYPLYKHRDTGEKVVVRKGELDNRSVVPYNPYLLAMFDCQLNVEVCSSINAVKYLYKYVYKGESYSMLRTRLLLCWWIKLKYINLVGGCHLQRQAGEFLVSTYSIDTHMYNLCQFTHPMARFSENEELADVIDDEARAKTMLTEFIITNSSIEGGQRYLYSEFPEYFVWNDKKKFWKPRDRGVVVGRVAHASPGEGERYYLRLLLAHVRGPKSFEDLKTVDDICCVSFQEVALKRGILEDDNAADMCMDEAVQVEMPNALRRLFATILIFSCPNNSAEFWEKYYGLLSEYFRKQFPGDHAKVLQLTTGKVEHFLEGMGKTFTQFGLDHLHFEQETILQCTRDISDALNALVLLLQLTSRKKLNVKQRTAYKAIIEHVKAAKGGAFFINGPGGTGKTFLYGALYAKVRSIGKICLPTATSGIVASNLPTGRTTHSMFKIPLDTEETLTCDVPKQGGLSCLIREAALII
ncbi:uncharacterized protein LOC141588417 [Silene latifolia]|uniref:uncharacterized protein LOC141588417 n=1 Tax=Silene latifolia TaxID=37657 RepID=UPI003D780F71